MKNTQNIMEGLNEEQVKIVKKLKRNNYENVKVEIIGTWVWVSGDTKPHKNILAKMGLHYSGAKKMWYLDSGDRKKSSTYHRSLNFAKKRHNTVSVIG